MIKFEKKEGGAKKISCQLVYDITLPNSLEAVGVKGGCCRMVKPLW